MAWLGIGGAASCRGHEAVCVGAACATSPSAAGQGGAAGEPDAEAGGAAGPGAGGLMEPEESSCPLCKDGTTCAEAEGRCRYAEPSPWVLIAKPDSLLGIPVLEIGARPLIPLWRDPQPQTWSVVGADWVPDGQAAVVVKYEGQQMFSYWTMRFGDALPGKLRPLRDVPNDIFTLSGPVISFDSRYALSEDPISGIFLSSLRDSQQPTLLLGTPEDGLTGADFCARSATWIEGYEDDTQLLARLEGGEIERRPLKSSPWRAGPSVDGRLLLSTKLQTDEDYEEGDQHGVTLEPCAFDDWFLEFPEAVDGALSRDASLLLLDLAAGGQKLLQIDDPRHPRELRATTDDELRCEPIFSSDSQRMLCLRGKSWVSVAVDDPSAPEVPLFGDGAASIATASAVPLIGGGALLAWQKGESKQGLSLQSLTRSGISRVVVDADESSVDLYRSSHDSERVFVVVTNEQGSELYSVRLDSDESIAIRLLTVEGALTTLSPTDDGLALAIGDSAYFAPFLPTAKLGEPILLADGVNQVTVQPWP